MFPKKNKLSSEDIRGVFKSPFKSFKTDTFNIVFIPNKERVAFAVIVSRKIARKAHKRNLFKRRIFSVLKDLLKDFNNGLYIIIVKKEIENEKKKTFIKDIKMFLDSNN